LTPHRLETAKRKATQKGPKIGEDAIRMIPDSPAAFVVNKDFVISETIDEETIIINLNSGSYFSLKHSGVAIWRLLQSPISVQAIVSVVIQDFDINADYASGEVETFVARLSEEGLVSAITPPADISPELASAPVSRQPYVAPSLEKFTDMEAMLLLDPIHDVDEAGWPQLPQSASVRPVNAE
jgi:Coenzyme PQQ synthesis protein D (PqqD)